MIYGQTRELPKEKDQTKQVSIHNKFEIEVRHTDTGIVEKHEAYNTVLDVGLKNIVGRQNNNVMYVLQFGEDTTEPSRDQTGLLKAFGTVEFSRAYTVAMVNSHTVAIRDKAYVSTSQYNGKIFAELGAHSYAGGIFNRALFQDINGNPITILKDDKMEITIYLTIYLDFKLLPHQSLVGLQFKEPLVSLLYNSQIYAGSKLLPTGSYSQIMGGMPARPAGTTSITWSIPRIEPGSGNNNGGYLINFCAGVLDYFPLMNMSKYEITGQPLGTGNGVKTDFGTGYPMKTIEIKKNGLTVPESDYTFHPLGRRTGETAINYGIVCNCYLLHTSYNQPMDYSEVANQDSQFYQRWYLESGKWIEFKSADGDAIITAAQWICNGVSIQTMTSVDGLTWEDHGTNWSVTMSTPKSRIKFKLNETTPGVPITAGVMFRTYSGVPQIRFKTPPATGDVLTYSGVPACIPKNDQYVIDGTATVDWTPSQI